MTLCIHCGGPGGLKPRSNDAQLDPALSKVTVLKGQQLFGYRGLGGVREYFLLTRAVTPCHLLNSRNPEKQLL